MVGWPCTASTLTFRGTWIGSLGPTARRELLWGCSEWERTHLAAIGKGGQVIRGPKSNSCLSTDMVHTIIGGRRSLPGSEEAWLWGKPTRSQLQSEPWDPPLCSITSASGWGRTLCFNCLEMSYCLAFESLFILFPPPEISSNNPPYPSLVKELIMPL